MRSFCCHTAPYRNDHCVTHSTSASPNRACSLGFVQVVQSLDSDRALRKRFNLCHISILKGEVEYMSVTEEEERLHGSERPDHSSSVIEDFICLYSASPSVYFVE